MLRLLRSSIFLFALLVSLRGEAQTWKQIGSLPAGSDLRCAYFWDTAHGVVGGVGCIYTYRSGVWKQATYPEQPDTIKSLRLLDAAHLYATGGITDAWVSTDSGATWKLSGTGIQGADDIYRSKDGNIHGLNISGTGMQKGTTFARSSPNSCLISADDNQPFYSLDGGIHWKQVPPNGLPPEGYSCAADSCTGKFYTSTDGPKIELFSSTNDGQTWVFITDFVNSAVDVLDGGEFGILYVRGTDSSIYRSLNGGMSFTKFSHAGLNPGSDERRMFAFGPLLRYLIVPDRANVWLFDDGLQSPVATIAQIIGTNYNVSVCDSTLRIGLPSCYASLIKLTGAIITSGSNFIHVDSIISSNTSDTIVLNFDLNSLGAHPFNLMLTGFDIYDSTHQFQSTAFMTLTAYGGVPTLLPDTVTTLASCARDPISVIVHNSCLTIFDSIKFIDSPATVRYNYFSTNYSGDTLWFLAPHLKPGTYVDSFWVYYFTAKRDSVFGKIILHILPNSTDPFVTYNRNLTSTNCRQTTIPVVFHAPPCDSIEVNSCAVSISKGLQFSSSPPFPIIIPSGGTDTLWITIPPQNASGVYSIFANPTGSYLGAAQLFDSSFQISATFVTSTSILEPATQAVDLDTITICQSSDTTITFHNPGCDPITITSHDFTLGQGWSITDSTFPFTLDTNASFTVHVHYAPQCIGDSSQAISYVFNAPGKTGLVSGEVDLNVVVVPAPVSCILSGTAFAFGPYPHCQNMSGDTLVTLTNTGCDSLALSNVSIAGTGFSLVSGGDIELAPNQTATYRIHFSDSVPNSYSGLFHITGIGAHGGNRIDTTIALSATILPGTRSAAIDKTAIDFGTTSICDERDSSITIANTGCEADTITNITFSNGDFGLTSSFTYPIILLPDSSLTVPISTHVDTTAKTSSNVGTLVVTLSSGVTVSNVSLSRGLTYPGAFSLSISSEPSAPVKSMVPVYVTRIGTIPGSASEVDFDVIYDDNLLQFNSPSQPDILPKTASVLPNGLTNRTFQMLPATDRDTIATLEFQSYLTKNLSTNITLERPQFISGGEISPECVASVDTSATNSNFTLQLSCQDSVILAAWNGTEPFSIESIVPNPAQSEITVRVVSADPGGLVAAVGDHHAGINYELFNALGQSSISGTFELGVQSSPLHIGVSSLTAGTYYLRLSEAGYVETRKVEIVR